MNPVAARSPIGIPLSLTQVSRLSASTSPSTGLPATLVPTVCSATRLRKSRRLRVTARNVTIRFRYPPTLRRRVKVKPHHPRCRWRQRAPVITKRTAKRPWHPQPLQQVRTPDQFRLRLLRLEGQRLRQRGQSPPHSPRQNNRESRQACHIPDLRIPLEVLQHHPLPQPPESLRPHRARTSHASTSQSRLSSPPGAFLSDSRRVTLPRPSQRLRPRSPVPSTNPQNPRHREPHPDYRRNHPSRHGRSPWFSHRRPNRQFNRDRRHQPQRGRPRPLPEVAQHSLARLPVTCHRPSQNQPPGRQPSRQPYPCRGITFDRHYPAITRHPVKNHPQRRQRQNRHATGPQRRINRRSLANIRPRRHQRRPQPDPHRRPERTWIAPLKPLPNRVDPRDAPSHEAHEPDGHAPAPANRSWYPAFARTSSSAYPFSTASSTTKQTNGSTSRGHRTGWVAPKSLDPQHPAIPPPQHDAASGTKTEDEQLLVVRHWQFPYFSIANRFRSRVKVGTICCACCCHHTFRPYHDTSLPRNQAPDDSYRPITRLALCPPNPKLFDITWSTFASRAVLGT